HRLPILQRGLDAAEAYAFRSLGADAGVVDEGIEPRALRLQPPAHFGDGTKRITWIGKIDLDVVLGPHLPWTVLRKRLPRAGDHAPPCGGEPFDGRMPDPTRGAGRDQCLSLGIAGYGHGVTGSMNNDHELRMCVAA